MVLVSVFWDADTKEKLNVQELLLGTMPVWGEQEEQESRQTGKQVDPSEGEERRGSMEAC